MKTTTRIVGALSGLALAAGALSACDSGTSSAESSDQGPKVVVASLAAADTLDELGKKDLVVGIPKKTQLPEALSAYADEKYTDIGTLKEPDMDAIAQLGPDVVFYGARTKALEAEYAKLAERTVYGDAEYTDTVASNRARVEEVAEIAGAGDAATAKLDEIDRKVEATRAKAEKAGTAIVLMTSGGKVSAYGKGSRFDLIFNELGMKPAGEIPNSGQHGAPLSWEQIAELDPDHVFVLDRDATIGQQGQAAEALLDNPVFQGTKAARNGDVHMLDGQDWYLVGSGLGVLGDMIADVDAAVS